MKQVLTAVILTTAYSTLFAQDAQPHKYPCAILLQLNSEHNRIEALNKKGRATDLETVKMDASNEQRAMINDFKEKFHYCPVYYFMDTDATLVMNRQFTGTIRSLDGEVLQKTIPCFDSSRFLIVYYGTPSAQSRRKEYADPDSSYGTPSGRGLIILDDQFRQISYIYKLGMADIFNKPKKNYYSSSLFDIEYYPLAERFDKRLRERRNQSDKIRISK